MRAVMLAMALALVGCLAPTQYDPAVYGTVKVAFGPSVDGSDQDWLPDQLTELRDELADMGRLGPLWQEVGEGDADVVVRPFDARACTAGAGSYSPGAGFVEVDPDAACTPGFSALRRAVAHELMHWWTWHTARWVGHLCQDPSDRPDCHPTITCRDCVLSPGLSTSPSGSSGEEDWQAGSDFIDPAPQAADLALFARCHAGHCD